MKAGAILLALLAALPCAANPFNHDRPGPSSTLTLDQAHVAANMSLIVLHTVSSRPMWSSEISGCSMQPTIGDSAVAIVEKVDVSELRVGDWICSVEPSTGRCIAHRVFEITKAGAWCIGDNNSSPDRYRVTNANLTGRIVAVFYVGTPANRR